MQPYLADRPSHRVRFAALAALLVAGATAFLALRPTPIDRDHVVGRCAQARIYR